MCVSAHLFVCVCVLAYLFLAQAHVFCCCREAELVNSRGEGGLFVKVHTHVEECGQRQWVAIGLIMRSVQGCRVGQSYISILVLDEPSGPLQ